MKTIKTSYSAYETLNGGIFLLTHDGTEAKMFGDYRNHDGVSGLLRDIDELARTKCTNDIYASEQPLYDYFKDFLKEECVLLIKGKSEQTNFINSGSSYKMGVEL